MITIEFYGLYRLNYKMAKTQLEASTLKDLLEKIAVKYPVYSYKELKNSVILINEVNFIKLKKFRTPLKDGDVVFIMSPASGG
ncbi:MAG: MoaD/ThiS family protein [Clostridia bacterium]